MPRVAGVHLERHVGMGRQRARGHGRSVRRGRRALRAARLGPAGAPRARSTACCSEVVLASVTCRRRARRASGAADASRSVTSATYRRRLATRAIPVGVDALAIVDVQQPADARRSASSSGPAARPATQRPRTGPTTSGCRRRRRRARARSRRGSCARFTARPRSRKRSQLLDLRRPSRRNRLANDSAARSRAACGRAPCGSRPAGTGSRPRPARSTSRRLPPSRARKPAVEAELLAMRGRRSRAPCRWSCRATCAVRARAAAGTASGCRSAAAAAGCRPRDVDALVEQVDREHNSTSARRRDRAAQPGARRSGLSPHTATAAMPCSLKCARHEAGVLDADAEPEARIVPTSSTCVDELLQTWRAQTSLLV